MASVCSFQTSYAHTSTSPALARCAANRLPTAPQPTMQIFIRRGLSRSLLRCSPACRFRCFLPGKELPRDLGEAFPLALADAIGVLGVKTDLAIAIDHLWVKGEDHVLFKRHLALGANRRIFEHGRANRVSGEVSERETVLRECLGHHSMNVASEFAGAHHFARRLQRHGIRIRHLLRGRARLASEQRARELDPVSPCARYL